MSTKKEKYMCNQCSRCAVENTAVLGCADDDCPCHQSESIEWEEVQEVHSEVIKVMESIGFGLLLDGQTFYKKGYELKPREHTTFSMTQAYEIKNAITTAVAKRELEIAEGVKGKVYSGELSETDSNTVLSIIKH